MMGFPETHWPRGFYKTIFPKYIQKLQKAEWTTGILAVVLH